MSADISFVSFSSCSVRARGLSLRNGKVLLQLCKLNALNRQALAEVVMKLTRDAGTLFLLRMDQVAAKPLKVRRCSLLSRTLPQKSGDQHGLEDDEHNPGDDVFLVTFPE